MARYKAIGRMQFQKEAQDQIAKREEIALRRAMAKEQHELNITLAQQKHDAEMTEIKMRSKEGAAERQHREKESAAERKFRKEEGAANRQHREKESAAERKFRKEEGAANRQFQEDMKYADIDAQAEQKKLDREATAERDKFVATERANEAKLKAQVESITPESVVSALNDTSYKSFDGEQADANGNYRVFSVPAWIESQVEGAVEDADYIVLDKLRKTERYQKELAPVAEKARITARKIATEQANSELAKMTQKVKQYILAGETPEDAFENVKIEFGSQSNSLFAKSFKSRKKPREITSQKIRNSK